MNIPNALTLARIILVPLIVWLIIAHEIAAAFVLFLLAGLSDAVDGYLAKRFGWQTELGAYLDPIADKALLALSRRTMSQPVSIAIGHSD